jgi:hypothetical protein
MTAPLAFAAAWAGPQGRGLIEVLEEVLRVADTEGARLGVMGGAGSLQTTPGGPLLVETLDFPAAAKPESTAQKAVLDSPRATDADVDWFYVVRLAERHRQHALAGGVGKGREPGGCRRPRVPGWRVRPAGVIGVNNLGGQDRACPSGPAGDVSWQGRGER